jgi:hypothetical protein
MHKGISLLAVAITEEKGVATVKGFEDLFQNILTVVLGLAGIGLFIMLLLGGFQFITSGGDPKGVEQAKHTLTYAIGGVVLIAAGYLIIQIIQVFTNVPLSEFVIRK